MPQSNQGFDQLTLAVAFDAGDADDLARMDLELDAIDRGVPPVVVNNERLELQDRRPGAGRFFIDLEHDRPANDQQAGAAIERLEDLDPLLHADGEIGDSSLWIDVESVSGSQRGDFMARLC